MLIENILLLVSSLTAIVMLLVYGFNDYSNEGTATKWFYASSVSVVAWLGLSIVVSGTFAAQWIGLLMVAGLVTSIKFSPRYRPLDLMPAARLNLSLLTAGVVLVYGVVYLNSFSISINAPAVFWLSLLMMCFGFALSWFVDVALMDDARSYGGKHDSSDLSMRLNHTMTKNIVLVAAMVIISFVASRPMFNADDFYNRLQVDETVEFEPSSVLLDQSYARTVTSLFAKRIASSLLGEQIGLGSRVSIGEPAMQKVGGSLYWVFPLEHSKISRFLSNKVTPGYALVSASNQNDARLVLDQYEIAYGYSGFYFDKHVPRHLSKSGYSSYRQGTASFQIDADGRPHWVVPLMRSSIGFSAPEIKKAVIVDAGTGEISEYELDNIPSWVSRLIPENVVHAQVDHWGSFKYGYWSRIFSGDEVIEVTRGQGDESLSLVMLDNGRLAWYSGMQSSGDANHQGTMGFVLYDAITGETIFYRRIGVTERVAISTLEGQVQDLGYRASNPIPYNIGGQSTYLSLLMDSNSNVQQYGLVSYQNRSVNARGETLDQALANYYLALDRDSSSLQGESIQTRLSVTGTLARVSKVTIGSQDGIVFTLAEDGENARVYRASVEQGIEVMLAQPGDLVTFEVGRLDRTPVSVFSMSNHHFVNQ